MRFPKERQPRWALPIALSATLAAGLLISPALGGSGKKQSAKEPSATVLRVTGTRSPGRGSSGAPDALMASLALKKGRYYVSASFRATKTVPTMSFVSLQCSLALPGVPSATAFVQNVQGSGDQAGIVLHVAGKLRTPGAAELRCVSPPPQASGQTISEIELTAIKGKVKIRTVP
jgi:hypothetical protein